jgi:hypothetical protein
MCGINHDVVHHARRTAQRHVIVPFNARVGVAKDIAVALGDQDDDGRLIELGPEKRAI